MNITPEQAAALHVLLTSNPTTWKAVIRNVWSKGNPRNSQETELYRLRATHGPTWLSKTTAQSLRGALASVGPAVVRHYPNAEIGKRWAILNANNETIAYAWCEQLAQNIARLLNADPASAHWVENPYKDGI